MIKERNISRLFRKSLEGLKPYSSARDEFKDFNADMTFLDANENPFENGVNRYPDPQQRSLKSVLAGLKGVDEDQILLGNGSDEVLDLLFRIFCEPNEDNVITLPPTYGMYKVLAGVNAIENREVPLTVDFQPDLDNILKAADTNSKLLLLCSPNNPTANTFSESVIRDLLDRFPGVVVIDEAYIDFTDKASWLRQLSSFPNLVVTQTFSKAFGLAGIRLGICYASPEIIEMLNKIKPPYNVNELTQLRALERLEDMVSVRAEIDSILLERGRLEEALKNIGFIKKIFPSEANFILARVDNAPKRYDELLKQGIVVRDRSKQYLCENTLRFTVGTKEENIKLIQTLSELDNA